MPRTEYYNRVVYTNSAGEVHRDGDLPAREFNTGGKYWCIEGKCHRIDNPSIIGRDGDNTWCLNGKAFYISDYYPTLYPYKGILLEL